MILQVTWWGVADLDGVFFRVRRILAASRSCAVQLRPEWFPLSLTEGGRGVTLFVSERLLSDKCLKFNIWYNSERWAKNIPRTEAFSLTLFDAVAFGTKTTPLFAVKLLPDSGILCNNFAFSELVLEDCPGRLVDGVGGRWPRWGVVSVWIVLVVCLIVVVVLAGSVGLAVFVTSRDRI